MLPTDQKAYVGIREGRRWRRLADSRGKTQEEHIEARALAATSYRGRLDLGFSDSD